MVVISMFFRLELTDNAFKLALNHPRRHFKAVQFRQVVQQRPLQPHARERLEFAAVLVPDVLFERLQTFHAELLGKLVVDSGRHRFADFVDGNVEHRFLAGEARRPIVFGEVHHDLLGLSGSDVDQLVLETGNETAGAQLELVALGLAAGELLSVHAPDEIDDDDIARFRFTVVGDRGRRFVRIGQTLEGLVHFRFVPLGDQSLQLELGEVHRLDLRQHLHGHRVFEVTLVFESGNLDLRLARRPEPTILHHRFRRLVDRRLEDLASQRQLVALAKQGHGDLAGPEAGQPCGLRQLFQPGLNLLLDICGRDGDLEFSGQSVSLALSNLHRSPNGTSCSSRVNRPSTRVLCWRWFAGKRLTAFLLWCGRRDLNPHDLRHRYLKPACLPVPPRPQ